MSWPWPPTPGRCASNPPDLWRVAKLWTAVVLCIATYCTRPPGACLAGDCVNGFGSAKLPNEALYEGTFLNGRPSGRGQIRYPDRSLYVGEVENGLRQGFGMYRPTDSRLYVGRFSNDQFNGFGQYFFTSGEFEGQMYVGRFVNDQREGMGVYLSPDGTSYIGRFSGNEYVGSGTLMRIKKGGRSDFMFQCEGNFAKGILEGNGVCIWDDLSIYIGEWKGGKRVHGTFAFANRERIGESYTGPFKDDKFHGDGVYTFADGSIFEGEFREGEMTGKGRMRTTRLDSEFDSYEGYMYKGLFEGEGILKKRDGREYRGHFHLGQFEGRGEIRDARGRVIETGEYKEGQLVR